MPRLQDSARQLLGAVIAIGLLSAPARAAELTQYLPDGTQLLLAFNVKQLLDAPLMKSDEKALREALGEAGKLLEGFGVDPAKDISRVVFVAGEPMQAKNALVLVEGRFDPVRVQTRLEQLAKDKKYTLETVKEGTATFFQGRVPKQALPMPGLPNRFFLTVLDGQYIAIAAEVEPLKQAVAKKDAARSADVRKPVLELIGRIGPKETVSIVSVPPAEALAGSPAAGLTTITGGITVSDGIVTDLLLSTKDAASAKELGEKVEEAVNQIKQLLPLLAGQQPGFGPKEQALFREIMDTVKTTARENGVTIKSTISKEFIEKNSKKDQ